jgi:hypothetical protein
MALMTPPSETSNEDATESGMTLSLQEEGDVAQENLEYSGVAAFVK